MTAQEVRIIGIAVGKAVDDTLAEFIKDERVRGIMRGAVIQKLGENLAMLLNPKKND